MSAATEHKLRLAHRRECEQATKLSKAEKRIDELEKQVAQLTTALADAQKPRRRRKQTQKEQENASS